MKEIWKDIKGFEGLYQVSNLGEVKSLNYRGHGKEKLLKQSHTNGYPVVVLYINGDKFQKYIHRLVAETFIPNPNNLPQVNHIDGVKMNNNVSNLEWCSVAHNLVHAIDTGLRQRFNNIPVLCEELGIEFSSGRKCAEYFNVSQTTISHIIRGKQKKLFNKYTINIIKKPA